MPKTAAGDLPLLKYADELVDELRGHIPKALKEFDSKSIHQARVATRRLKAMLDLMRPVLSAEHRKPFAKVLRKLRRRLGPLRDLDVMIEHLSEPTSSVAYRPAVQWLDEQLRVRRETARRECGDQGSSGGILGRVGTWWGLREEVAECKDAIEVLLAEALHLQMDAFAEQARRLIGDVDRSDAKKKQPLADAGRPAQEQRQDPHQLRIAGKVVRYTLEFAAAEGHKLPPTVTRSFKKMQDELGYWHDFVVLSERAMQISLEQLLPHHNSNLQTNVLDLSKLLLRKSSRHLDRFGKLWRSRGEELAIAIRERFPLTHPVNAFRMDPDPAHSLDMSDPPMPAVSVAQGA